MIGYLVISWNPWDCEDIYKKVFVSNEEALDYVYNYDYNSGKEEELHIVTVEIGD